MERDEAMRPYNPPPSYGGTPSDPPVLVTKIPSGFAGTVAVIHYVSWFARDALRDERVNQLARSLTSHVASRDTRGEALACFEFIRDRGSGGFRYTDLPSEGRYGSGFQRLQHPSYTLFDAPNRSGECASLSCALAALLLSLGHDVRWRTGGSDGRKPLEFEHVYDLDEIDGVIVPMDPSFADPMGAERPEAQVVKDWWLID